jgi:hypothetical protein
VISVKEIKKKIVKVKDGKAWIDISALRKVKLGKIITQHSIKQLYSPLPFIHPMH